MGFSRKLTLAALALSGLAAAPAHAAVQAVPLSQYTPEAVYGGFNIASLSGGGSDIGDAGLAGRFLDTIQDTTTQVSMQEYTFCIDAVTHFYTYKDYDITPIASVIGDSTKDEQLAALLSHASATIASAASVSATEASDAAAGFQLAVWAIVYDTGITSGYDLSTGNFNTYGDFGEGTEPYTLGSNYLANVENNVWNGDASLVRALVAVEPGSTQNQIFILPAAVPEPKTWLSLLLGFGFLGAALRRRRTLAAMPA